MNVFIGWSGEIGRKTANCLAKWLRVFFQDRMTVLTSSDTAMGDSWTDRLHAVMESADYSLLCVTRSSSQSWLCYEAGALSTGGKYVKPVLFFGVSPSELWEPLRRFQTVAADREGIYQLVFELNICLEKNGDSSQEGTKLSAFSEERLDARFNVLYQALEADLTNLEREQAALKRRRQDRETAETRLDEVNRKLDTVLSALSAMSSAGQP